MKDIGEYLNWVRTNDKASKQGINATFAYKNKDFILKMLQSNYSLRIIYNYFYEQQKITCSYSNFLRIVKTYVCKSQHIRDLRKAGIETMSQNFQNSQSVQSTEELNIGVNKRSRRKVLNNSIRKRLESSRKRLESSI
ncbi:MAG: hypothetical protein IJ078_05760 [Succinivibrionaceae bacterium]|nr:hypothetical protein [Succinivibrionaceae bacterium]